MKNKIQSILFDKRDFTKTAANRWMKKHNIHPIKKVDDSSKFFLRYRLIEPSKDYKYITKNILDNKIKLIIIV